MPPLPVALAYLWKAYHRLRRRKAGGFNGHDKIEWPDIHAFVSLTGTKLAPWEIGLIEDIDDIFLVAMAEAREGTATEQAEAGRDALKQIGKPR